MLSYIDAVSAVKDRYNIDLSGLTHTERKVKLNRMGLDIGLDGRDWYVDSKNIKPLRCSECGKFVSISTSYCVGREVYCSKCKPNQNNSCLWCDHTTDNTDLCSECSNSRNGLRSAGWGPVRLKKLRTKSDTPESTLYGIELEVDSDTGRLYDLIQDLSSNFLPYMWFTGDCTLSTKGVEITTLPMSCDFHTNKFYWDIMEEILYKHDYVNNSRAGCHIHMSRNGLTPHQQIKIGIFWYSQIHFMNRIARRQCGSYRQYKAWKRCYNEGRRNLLNKHNPSGYDRSAINFIPNETIEFRQFNGTWKERDVLGSIQFLEELKKFCKTRGVSYLLTDKALEEFKSVLKDTRFHKLQEYLSEKGL